MNIESCEKFGRKFIFHLVGNGLCYPDIGNILAYDQAVQRREMLDITEMDRMLIDTAHTDESR